MDTRQTMIRVAHSIDTNSLNLPFMYLHSQFGYSVESIFRQLHNQSYLDLGIFPETFPNTITEFYWIRNSENCWFALGKLSTDIYFYFTANAEEEFFNSKTKQKTGAMHLWLSHNYADLINWSMDSENYNIYITETLPL
jgi:hypothetical protein